MVPHINGKAMVLGRVYVRFTLGSSPTILPAATYKNTYIYIPIPKVGDFGMGPDRQHGVWLEEKRRDGRVGVYTTCLLCGGVNNISTNDISPDGISQCFYCRRCQLVSRVILVDWEEHRDPPVPFIVEPYHL